MLCCTLCSLHDHPSGQFNPSPAWPAYYKIKVIILDCALTSAVLEFQFYMKKIPHDIVFFPPFLFLFTLKLCSTNWGGAECFISWVFTRTSKLLRVIKRHELSWTQSTKVLLYHQYVSFSVLCTWSVKCRRMYLMKDNLYTVHFNFHYLIPTNYSIAAHYPV